MKQMDQDNCLMCLAQRILRPISVALAVLVTACSTGRMLVEERFYLAVPSGENTNYYRVTVNAETTYGDAKYDSGWFPADTVDRLYGNPAKPGAASALNTEEDIKAELNAAIKKTAEGYLRAASNPRSNPDTIVAWLEAQRRVRAMAGDGVPLPPGAVEIEYDPSANLAIRHAGEKLVFILSSDPTQVIDSMKAFAEDNKTSASVLRLADVVRQRATNEITVVEAKNEAGARMDPIIVTQIDGALGIAQGSPSKEQLLQAVEGLIVLVESLQ